MPKCDWLVRFVCFSLKFAFEAVIYLASHPSTTDFPSLGPSLMILSTKLKIELPFLGVIDDECNKCGERSFGTLDFILHVLFLPEILW